MIHVLFQDITVDPKPAITAGTILNDLNNFLDKTKFYGKLILTYEAGKVSNIKYEQSFSVDELVKSLSI